MYEIINSIHNSDKSQNLNFNLDKEIDNYKKEFKHTDKELEIIQYKKCKLTNLQKEILSFSFQ